MARIPSSRRQARPPKPQKSRTGGGGGGEQKQIGSFDGQRSTHRRRPLPANAEHARGERPALPGGMHLGRAAVLLDRRNGPARSGRVRHRALASREGPSEAPIPSVTSSPAWEDPRRDNGRGALNTYHCKSDRHRDQNFVSLGRSVVISTCQLSRTHRVTVHISPRRGLLNADNRTGSPLSPPSKSAAYLVSLLRPVNCGSPGRFFTTPSTGNSATEQHLPGRPRIRGVRLKSAVTSYWLVVSGGGPRP